VNFVKIPTKIDKNLFQDSIIGFLTGTETGGAAIGAAVGAAIGAAVGAAIGASVGAGIGLTGKEAETADVIRIGRLVVVVLMGEKNQKWLRKHW
jgi:hypothetical protein